nr:hypothetical protein [Tanacetum cinerariifolium]
MMQKESICLPNGEIFAELARMGYEKPSTKLTFYKAFFSSQWKFLIYTILQSMSAKHTSWNEFSSAMASPAIYLSTCIKFNFSKYIFESLLRNVDSSSKFYMYLRFIQLIIKNQLGKGFSGAETPLFEGMLVGVIEEQGDAIEQGRQAEIYQIDMDHASKVLSMKEDEPEVQEVVDVVTTTKLITKVVTTAIRVAAASTRRRKGVVIRDPEEESTTIIPADTNSKDKGKGIMVEEPKPLKKKHQVEMDEEFARKLHEELNKDINWDVAIDHVKQNSKEDPFVQRYQVMKKRPQTEAQARNNMIMYLKNVAGFRLDYFKGMSYDNIPKRRKLNEEVEDLKRNLEIVPDEVDDVHTEAIPLARKDMIVAGAENCPPMLDKIMYNSWLSHMLIYIKEKKNGRMMIESIKNRPLAYLTIEEDGKIRDKKYAEITKQEKFQGDCDVQATKIVLQAFLANPGVVYGQATQKTILRNVAFQTVDLDAYDSNCDDISSTKAVLMANLSSYDSDVLSKVPQHDTYQNDDMVNQSVQE